MIRRPPIVTLTHTPVPYPTLFRSQFHDLDFLSPRLDVEADRVADDHHHRDAQQGRNDADKSEEHTSELQSLMRISYAVFCLKKKTIINIQAIRIKQE